MASIPVLPVEQAPDLMNAIANIADSDPDLAPITDSGAKVCLQQIAKALQTVVTSIVTMKNSVITETSTADVAFKKLEVSVAELCSRTDDITTRLPPPGMFPDAKPFSSFIKICETKSIANLKPFGEDRTGFRLWHDKLINAISQHVTGSRGLFAEMKSQLTNNKNGLTHAEWKIMWNSYTSLLGNNFDKTMTFDKFNEDLYYILTEKTEGDAAARVRAVEPGQGFEAYQRVYIWFSSTCGMALNKRMDGLMVPASPTKPEELAAAIEK